MVIVTNIRIKERFDVKKREKKNILICLQKRLMFCDLYKNTVYYTRIWRPQTQ